MISEPLVRSHISVYLPPEDARGAYFHGRGDLCQDSANIPPSVPTSLQYLAINLYTLVVDFIYVRRPVESPLLSLGHI